MKTHILLFVILALFFASRTFSQNYQQPKDLGYPTVSEVIEFLKQEVTKPLKDAYYLNLEKKPTGYYLQVTSYVLEGDGPVHARLKIWDAATKVYTSPELTGFLDMAGEDEAAQLNWGPISQTAGITDFYPYYGYPGWADDNRALLDPAQALTGYELEVLARTYGQLANACVHPMGSKRNFPFATNFVQPLYEELPAEQLQLYLRYQDSSLLFWDRIVAEYPTHLTYLIGDLNLKVANEYVHTYMTLSSVKRKDLGQRYLDQTHYDACYLDIARNMLDACETNGILVTNGDSDSYPLWYVQEKERYRNDVAVVNLSLLQLPWYVDFVGHAYQLKFRTQPDMVDRLQRFYYLPEGDGFEDWAEVLDTVLAAAVAETEPGKGIPFAAGLRACTKGGELDLMVRRNHVLGVDVMLIDLVSSNCERSVSTTSMYSWNAFETENHAANRGLVDEISGKVVPKYDRTSMQRWKSGLEILTVPCLKEGDGLAMGQLAEVLIHTIEAWQEYDHYGLTEADRDELAAMMDMYFLNNPINIVSGKHDHYLNANLVDFLGHSPQLKSNFLKGFFNDDAGLPAQLSPDYLLEGGALTIMHYADALNRLHYQFANDAALQQDIRKRAQRLQSDLNLMQTTYSERLESVMFYIGRAQDDLSEIVR